MTLAETPPMTADAPMLTAGEAIERSGWGSSFHFVQPRNLGFWLYLALVGWGVLAAIQLALPGTQIAQGSLAATAAVFACYSLPFVVFFRQIDRFRSVPGSLALAAFVYGGFAATAVIAINGNNALFSIYGKTFGAAFGIKWSAALAAPFMEEFGKASGLLLLILLAPRLFRTAFDGLIVGSFLGLGFQIVENVVYGFRGGSSGFDLDNVQGAVQNAVMRMGTGIFSHWLYSGIFCAGVIWLLGRPDEPARRVRGILLMVAAMVGHGMWDAGSGLLSVSIFFLPLGYLIVPLSIVLIYRWIYQTSVRPERAWARAILEPEVVLGIATQAEVDAFVGSRKQRKAFLASVGRDRRHERHVLEALRDLLFALCRTDREDSPPVVHARSEIQRLRGTSPNPTTPPVA